MKMLCLLPLLRLVSGCIPYRSGRNIFSVSVFNIYVDNFNVLSLGKFLKFLSLFSLVLSLSGCVFYETQMTDVPLISKKGDLQMDAGVSLIPSVFTSVSYGLTDKLALQGYGRLGVTGYYMQTAMGTYRNFGDGRILELYGGWGYGNGDAYNDANPGHLKGNYQLLFTQVNIGKLHYNGAPFDIGVGLKAGYLHTNLKDMNYYDDYDDESIYRVRRDESLLIEPVAVFRFGSKRLKFSFKVGNTLLIKFTNKRDDLPYGFINFGAGVSYRL